MMGGLAIDRLHEQQFQIIGGAQIVWHPRLRHRLFPQHAAALPSQRIPILVIIINDRLIETPFQVLVNDLRSEQI